MLSSRNTKNYLFLSLYLQNCSALFQTCLSLRGSLQIQSNLFQSMHLRKKTKTACLKHVHAYNRSISSENYSFAYEKKRFLLNIGGL